MGLLTTGQITIVDNNDAKPITAYVVASQSTMQVYSKDESTITYTPDWVSTPNILTAKVFVGGSVAEVAATLTNRKWSVDFGTSLGSGTTLTLNTNCTPGVAAKSYYFEGDYTDVVTGLVSHVIAQITLGMVNTGTNAVYVITRGNNSIQESDTATKNCAVICGDLMRASGVDTSGVTYQFYEANGATQISTSTASYATKYGLKTTAGGVSPTGVAGELGINIPAAAAWSTYNTLVISEAAITDIGVFRVVAKDADGTSYQAYFTIMDSSDPYDCKLISTSGDKLQNGVGSTNIYPAVYNGSTPVTALTGWSFKWYYYDGASPGNRAGFVDTTRTALAGGRPITANTAGATSAITFTGSAITFAAGDMIKVVDTVGVARYYEISTVGAANVVAVRAATISTFLNAVWPTSSITLSQFVGGVMYVCKGTGATAGTQTTTGATGVAAQITVTGDEIDGKGTILCEVTRP